MRIKGAFFAVWVLATCFEPAHGEPQATIKQSWEPSKPLTPNTTGWFTYSYQASPAGGGGLKIALYGVAGGGDECCVPPETSMAISIEPNR
jgi:hypothetical protein